MRTRISHLEHYRQKGNAGDDIMTSKHLFALSYIAKIFEHNQANRGKMAHVLLKAFM